MKTAFRTITALSLFMAFTAALAALAAESETLRVRVPFAFTAGRASLLAGEYVISRQPETHIVTIGGNCGSAMLVAIPQGTNSPDVKASNLTFERTSKGNTLREVQLSGQPSTIMAHAK